MTVMQTTAAATEKAHEEAREGIREGLRGGTHEEGPNRTDLCSAPPRRHPRPDGQDRYTISEVVAFTGLSAHTLRWYERIGLMSHIDRSHTGQRRYTNRDLDWLDLVGKLRLTGMPVADMVRYAELVRAGDGTFAERRELLETTRQDVLERIAELQDTLAVLDRKISFYADAGRAHASHEASHQTSHEASQEGERTR